MKIVKNCCCGNVESIDLTAEEYQNYKKWRAGEIYIQDIGGLTPCEREFLKTGLCRKCQKMIFNNNQTNRIKAERK